MTGIAGAADQQDASIHRCPQCGIEEGDRHPVTGKIVNCLPIAAAVFGVGIVCWCSEECHDDWNRR